MIEKVAQASSNKLLQFTLLIATIVLYFLVNQRFIAEADRQYSGDVISCTPSCYESAKKTGSDIPFVNNWRSASAIGFELPGKHLTLYANIYKCKFIDFHSAYHHKLHFKQYAVSFVLKSLLAVLLI